jgi:myb proto-oncogene protein
MEEESTSASGSAGSHSPIDVFSPPEVQYDDEEELDYDNLSEMLAQQLQDVGDYFSADMLPYFSDIPMETPPATESGLGKLDRLLLTNRQYQQALRDQLVLLEEGQKMTRDLQRWLKMLLVQMNRRKKVGAPESPLALVDSRGGMPPENEEAKRVKPLLTEYSKIIRPPIRWTEREKLALAKGVRQQNQMILVDRILAGEEVFGYNGSLYDQNRNEAYQQAVSAVQRMSQRELELNLDGLDWSKMSALFVTSRSPEDCRIQWTTIQHPLISNSPFSEVEKDKLINLVSRYGAQGRWIEIAGELGTNRTAWQCLSTYRQIAGKSIASGKWTEEEDRILIEGVQMYGMTDCWMEISEMLDGRTASQCIHRWNKTLDPHKKIGRWTAEEDAWLLAAIHRIGSANWSLVQNFVPNRTDVQCRERYMNVLHPQLKHDTFSAAEDAMLRKAVNTHGEGKWSQVAAALSNRTDNQCRRRWLYLSTRSTRGPKLARTKSKKIKPSLNPSLSSSSNDSGGGAPRRKSARLGSK